MKRVLSGIQPSGELHLGNYFGMMSRMIAYQEESDLFCFIVNYHALTTIHDREYLQANTLDAALDFLALGLDPEKATFWVQSDVPQVTELTWILSNLTGMGLLERATSYKDKIAQGVRPNVGLFSYPLLMAADILCFGGEIIPVGKDQKQHVEITRDIALRFNQTFGEVFIVPEPDIEEVNQLVPGIDGRKMSKSYGNTIPIFGDEERIRQLVMSIVTDSTPIQEPKPVDTPLFHLYSLFLTPGEREQLKERFQTPGLGYVAVKKELFAHLMDYFQPYREKRVYLQKHREDVLETLRKGATKAAAVADSFMRKVRSAVGLYYWD